MKALLLSILSLFIVNANSAQAKWKDYNDSCFNATKEFYSACQILTSSKEISSYKFKIDKSLIKFLNQFYNDPEFNFQTLKKNSAQFPNSMINQKEKNDTTLIEFYFNAEGNLRISVNSVLEGDILKSKEINIETKTQVLCNNDQMYVNALDFLYLKRLSNKFDFPLSLKPYQANLDIKVN